MLAVYAILHDPDYAISVALLHRPDIGFASGYSDPTRPRDPEVIVAGAENLMWNGLVKMIRFASPPHLRNSLPALKHRFIHAAPIIESAFDLAANPQIESEVTEALEELDPTFSLVDKDLAPQPLRDERIYNYITSSARWRIRTVELLGNFTVDDSLAYTVTEARRLSYGRMKNPRALDFIKPIEEDLAT